MEMAGWVWYNEAGKRFFLAPSLRGPAPPKAVAGAVAEVL